MVYLENKTELQELWIPRNDGQGVPYNPTKELEGVDVTISEDITVIHPSSGYYGMSAVTIDATEYGQQNYDNGFDDGYTDGYASGSTEGYESGYTSGYTSGSTDGYNSGYTSGETHQKSLLVSTAITQNGSYQRENGYSAITVNVPTGQTYNIEENHPFTATSNGDYTITPTSASTTVNTEYVPNQYGSGTYILTAYTQGYPSVGLFNLIKVYRESNPSDYAILYYKNGRLGYNLSEWGGSSVNLHNNVYSFYFVGNDCAWSPLEDYTFSYDVMSAVTLEVNVETASTYQSGYTSGYTDGYASGYTSGTTDGFNSGYTSGYTSGHTDGVDEEKAKMSAVTFTANTAVTLSDGSYSAVTVNVPQTGSTAVLGVGSFSANGTYFSSTDNLDGYSAITVSVPQTGSSKVISLVDYVHTDILSDDANDKYLDTGIIPTTATTFRVQGMTKGYGQGNAIVGYTYNDSEDYRLFWWNWYSTGSHLTFDFNNQRIDNRWGGSYDGRIVDITCSNYQAVSGDGTTLMTGTTQTTIDDPHTILIDVGSWWAKSLEIWDNGVKVFDGQAAIDNDGNIGLYDAVSMSMVYNSGLTMAYEGTPTPIPSQDYQSGYTDGYASGYTDGSASIASLIDRSITEVVIPSGTTKIGSYAFGFCESLSSVTIPNTVTKIGNYAFAWNKFSAITIPNTVTEIGNYAFSYTKLSAVTIPNSVTTIGNYFLGYCNSLESVTFPNQVTKIPNGACYGCSSLTSIYIPSSITEITIYSFRNCSALSEINVYATTAPTISNANAFQGVPSTGTVHYPAGSDYSSWQSNQYLSGWTFIADL